MKCPIPVRAGLNVLAPSRGRHQSDALGCRCCTNGVRGRVSFQRDRRGPSNVKNWEHAQHKPFNHPSMMGMMGISVCKQVTYTYVQYVNFYGLRMNF